MACSWCGEARANVNWLWNGVDCLNTSEVKAWVQWSKDGTGVLVHISNGGGTFSFQIWRWCCRWILCWGTSIRDHSWPLFHRPRLLWDTPTSIFMTSLAILRCGFRIILHNEGTKLSVLRGDEDGVSVYYPWTDLSEKLVFGEASMVRLSWNLPILQWCSSVGTFLSSNGAAELEPSFSMVRLRWNLPLI